ncbi:MAG: T9SS C-terminal target domain-containing protein [Chitinophagaceae bacterium]|nr:MAG: T9SS C-terminal target domain-containing protein [Chitinophagaceae bacterium]
MSKKNILLIPVFLILNLALVNAQSNFSPIVKNMVFDLEKLEKTNLDTNGDLPEEIINLYVLQWENNDWYTGYLAKFENINALTKIEKIEGARITSVFNNIVSFRMPWQYTPKLSEISEIVYIEAGNMIQPFLHEAVKDVNTDSVYSGINLPLPFYGKDVIVAVLDWGFDYTHPMFYDTLMQNFRIKRVWDMNDNSGTPPPAFGYGKELIGEQMIKAGLHDVPYWDENKSSHGTHVAGIAAGGGAGTQYRGVAPESELIFISMQQTPSGMADALAYVENYADDVGKAVVYNMSFGGHVFPHDGNDLLNAVIDDVAGQGRIFVGSMGNNGNPQFAFHIFNDFSQNSDTAKTMVEFVSINNSIGQVASIWEEDGNPFSISLGFPGPNGIVLAETPWYNSYDIPEVLEDTLFHNGDSIAYRISRSGPASNTGKSFMIVEIIKPIANRVVLQMHSDNARLHAWNLIRMKTYINNAGFLFSAGSGAGSPFPGYIQGDVSFGPTVPSGTGRNVITVGAYRAKRFVASTGNYVFGEIASFSSQGPTTDYRVKPDITAPGRLVISSLSSYQDGLNPFDYAETVDYEGRVYPFQALSGTSMSAPVVSGIVALMLEANPGLWPNQALDILQSTALHDQHTDSLSETSTGSNLWGRGKVNAYQAVLRALEVTGIERPRAYNQNAFLIYPNPVQNQFTILSEEILQEDFTINLYDATGRKVFQEYWSSNQNNSFLNLKLPGNIRSGYYILKLSSLSSEHTLPLIVKP